MSRPIQTGKRNFQRNRITLRHAQKTLMMNIVGVLSVLGPERFPDARSLQATGPLGRAAISA